MFLSSYSKKVKEKNTTIQLRVLWSKKIVETKIPLFADIMIAYTDNPKRMYRQMIRINEKSPGI